MTVRTAPILIAASLGITQPALSQTKDDSEPIDRIIVTGARAPVDAGRIGSATTIITRQDIERTQARYLPDLLRGVPGFAIAVSGGAGSQTQARVRGSEANHVLVLIDGVRANDPATTDEFHWEHFATGNIERVEIVRGPQSALWGSDAIGAVVNVITRAPADELTADGYVEGGSNGTRNAGTNASGRLGDWTFGGSVESLRTDGTNVSRLGDEKDGADLDTAAVALHYEGSDRLALDAMLRASDAATQFDPVDFLETGLPTDGDLETLSDNLMGRISASLAGDRLEWRFGIGYFDSRHRNLVDDAFDSSTASARVTFSLATDVRLDHNELSLAIEREDTEFEQRGAIVFGDPNQDQDMQATSLIAEYRRFQSARLSWILSARYDDYSDFADALTGRLSTTYRWTETTRLRASIGTGQKAPTFVERFGFFPAQFAGNADLKPESSLSYDIGVDRDWRNGALLFSASIYWQKLDDEIDGFVFDPASFLYTARNLGSESRRRGVELETHWRLNDAMRLGMSLTYTDSTEPNGDAGSVVELRRPRQSGRLSLSYRTPDQRFETMLTADYGGRRFDLLFPPFPEPERRVELSDYWLVDATVLFRLTPSLALFARGTNLLDASYEQVLGYRTPGRAAAVGVRAEFGR